MRGACVCEHPGHEGDRVVSRIELLEERREWRRLTDQGRAFTRVVRRVCMTCARRDATGADARQGVLV